MEQILLILKTAVVFAALLGVLVIIHELGHFAVARWAGMKVHEFAFGFGPILARLFKRDGTEYNIRLVPLGGFVRIAGMDPGESESIEGGFNTKPIYKRSLVILAGPVMSLLLGYVVFLLIGFAWGFPSDRATNEVAAVAKGSPAAVAKLQEGDRIVAIDGSATRNGLDVQKLTGASGGKTLAIQLQRDGKTVAVKTAPKLGERMGAKEKVWLLGIALMPEMEHVGVVESIGRGTKETVGFVGMMLSRLFSKQITQDVGGIVAIGYMTHQTVQSGPRAVFVELAMLSLMLGILNLLPLPVLDGGHLMYLLIEKIRGKRLAPESWYAIQMVGMALLLFLAVFLVYYDSVRILAGKMG